MVTLLPFRLESPFYSSSDASWRQMPAREESCILDLFKAGGLEQSISSHQRSGTLVNLPLFRSLDSPPPFLGPGKGLVTQHHGRGFLAPVSSPEIHSGHHDG